MIRCNNCMRTFESEDDLKILGHFTGTTIDAEGGIDFFPEYYKGCPDCHTDEYLMDIEE